MDGLRYYSLDSAREIVSKRRSDISLVQAVERFLGGRFMPGFGCKPRAALIRSTLSPDTRFDFFQFCAAYVGLEPLYAEHSNDMFLGLSEDKLGLARLRLTMGDGSRRTADIIDFRTYHGKMIPDVKVLSGERLVEFHHGLFHLCKPEITFECVSSYFSSFGRPCDYYPFYLANFVAHGILFETWESDVSKREYSFTENVVAKAFMEVEEALGAAPIIVRLYPENLTKDENYYWWGYPRPINDYLVDFVIRNRCKLRAVE